MRSSDQNQVN